MSALPKQLMSLPKVHMHKGVKAETHSIHPVNATGNTEFAYGGNNVISVMIPAYSRGFFNPARSQLHFNVTTPTGVYMAQGNPVFNRMLLRSGNGQVLEDINGLSSVERALSNFESITHKHANAARTGDFRVPMVTSTSDIGAAQLTELYTNTTKIEKDFVSGLLGKGQKYYLPVGMFNASGGYSFEIQLFLEDPKIACVKDDAATDLDYGYKLTDVNLQMEIVTMSQAITDRIDTELYSNNKVSIPYSTFRQHLSYVPANSKGVELSISDSAHDLECIYTLIRKQNLNVDALWDANGKYQGFKGGDNLSFLGGHLNRTKDAAASTNSEMLGTVDTYQFRYDTDYFPNRRAEMSPKDNKLALINAIHTLDLPNKDAFASSIMADGTSVWDQGGTFAIVQDFKNAKDEGVLSGLNSSATGAPLELSITFKKAQSEALRVEHFVKSNLTLNIMKGGQTSIINGSVRNDI